MNVQLVVAVVLILVFIGVLFGILIWSTVEENKRIEEVDNARSEWFKKYLDQDPINQEAYGVMDEMIQANYNRTKKLDYYSHRDKWLFIQGYKAGKNEKGT